MPGPHKKKTKGARVKKRKADSGKKAFRAEKGAAGGDSGLGGGADAATDKAARQRNPKAFIFSGSGKAKKSAARTAEREQRRMHGEAEQQNEWVCMEPKGEDQNNRVSVARQGTHGLCLDCRSCSCHHCGHSGIAADTDALHRGFALREDHLALGMAEQASMVLAAAGQRTSSRVITSYCCYWRHCLPFRSCAAISAEPLVDVEPHKD